MNPMMPPPYQPYPYCFHHPYGPQTAPHTHLNFYHNRSTGTDSLVNFNDHGENDKKSGTDKKPKKSSSKKHKSSTRVVNTEQDKDSVVARSEIAVRIQQDDHRSQSYSMVLNNKSETDKESQKPSEKPKKLKKVVVPQRDPKKDLKSIIKIQSWVRRWRARVAYRKLLDQERLKQQFFQASYEYFDPKAKGGPQKCLFIALIEMAKKVLKRFPKIKCPNKIFIQVINPKSSQVLYHNEYPLTAFGFK